MARNLDYEKTGLDRCKYYKAIYVNNNKLTQDAVVQGVFYSRDVEPIKQGNIVGSDDKNIQTIAKIETMDYVNDLALDDYVLLDSNLYLVQEMTMADINDNAKEYRRHANKTVLVLRR